MKQITILLVTLLLIIVAGIWEISYLKESSRYILSDMNSIWQTVERNEYEVAKKEATNLKNSWEEVKKTWAVFMDDSELEEIGDKLVSFVSYIDTANLEEIKHSYNRLSNSIKGAVEFECLKAENIF